MIVTVITRRPYGGRTLQRVWVNEDEVIANMRIEYKGLNVEFRSIDYVNLTLAEQMRTTIESDMIISMHGAGLVNVIWARPMTTVVEIFPRSGSAGDTATCASLLAATGMSSVEARTSVTIRPPTRRTSAFRTTSGWPSSTHSSAKPMALSRSSKRFYVERHRKPQ